MTDTCKNVIYSDEESGLQLELLIYIPDSENEKGFPLITFIPDASCAGKKESEILDRCFGARLLISEEWQKEHPCIIAIPCYPEVILDDHGSYTMTPYVSLTARLLRFLKQEYPVDENRIYGTGQSMGCMTTMFLASNYPDLYTATLLVSGQWDVNALTGLKTQKFIYVTAGGDIKASAGQKELMETFDQRNVPYVFAGGWNAKEDLTEKAESLLSSEDDHYFVQFTAGSVLPENGNLRANEHMCSFDYAYNIRPFLDWLFKQHSKQ